MPKLKKYISSLEDAFKSANKIVENNNLTIQEIAENINCDEELVEIFLNNDNDVSGALTRMFVFLNIRIKSKEFLFQSHKAYDNGTYVKIKRIINPQCSIYYDRTRQIFYDFSMKYKREKITETRKNIIITEMSDFLEKHLNS